MQGHKVKEYEKVANHSIQFSNNFQPTIAFVVSDDRHKNLVWFVQQHRTSDNTLDISAQLYEFDNQFRPHRVDNPQLRREVDPTAIRLIDPDLEMIGVYRQILIPSTAAERTHEEYGIIILFRVDKVIKYCWTPDKQLSSSVCILVFV